MRNRCMTLINIFFSFQLAFERAVGLGTDMLELDVHLSRDGVVVVGHDGDLARLCGRGDGALISQTDFADLPPVRPSVRIDFEPAGAEFADASVPEEGRRMASLEEVFHRFPSVAVNIDVKDHDKRLVAAVARLVRRHSRQDRTVWGNFRQETTELCRAADPQVGTVFSTRAVVRTLLLFYTGLLPFATIRETHFEIPMISTERRRRGKELSWRGAALVYLADKVLMRRSLFRHLRRRGIPTYAWVINTEEDYERAFKMGVEGVMTDYPTRLKKFLEEHPEYPEKI